MSIQNLANRLKILQIFKITLNLLKKTPDIFMHIAYLLISATFSAAKTSLCSTYFTFAHQRNFRSAKTSLQSNFTCAPHKLHQKTDPEARTKEGTPTIKQVLPSEKEKRSTGDLFVLLFTRPCLQGIVCNT